MSNKSEYIKRICEKLERCHYKVVDPDDVLSNEPNMLVDKDSYEVKCFKWLPEENLKLLADFNFAEWGSWDRAYQELGRRKILQFKPYVKSFPDGDQSLVLRHNRFLHLFRGYYFQTSMTIGGSGDAGHSSMRIDGIFKHAEPRRLAVKSKLYYMLFYAALIDCGFKYDSFIELFTSDRPVVDKFLQDSLNIWHMKFKYTWSDIQEYFTESQDVIIPAEHDNTFEVLASKGVLCRFYIDNDSIGVEYRKKGTLINNTMRLQIPKWCDGISLTWVEDNHIDPDDLEDLEYSVEQCFRHSYDYKLMLLTMLLKLCRIHMDWICAYSIGDLDTFSRMNSNEITVVESLNQVKIPGEEA